MPDVSGTGLFSYPGQLDRAVLHFFWRHPAQHAELAHCLTAVAMDDCAVLLAEASVAALNPDQWLPGRQGRWLVLSADLVTLGFASADLPAGIRGIDHQELAELVARCPRVQNWL